MNIMNIINIISSKSKFTSRPRVVPLGPCNNLLSPLLLFSPGSDGVRQPKLFYVSSSTSTTTISTETVCYHVLSTCTLSWWLLFLWQIFSPSHSGWIWSNEVRKKEKERSTKGRRRYCRPFKGPFSLLAWWLYAFCSLHTSSLPPSLLGWPVTDWGGEPPGVLQQQWWGERSQVPQLLAHQDCHRDKLFIHGNNINCDRTKLPNLPI